MVRERGEQVIATNRRARHDYAIEKTYEAGLVLTGTEVKSLRQGRANLTDGYAFIDGGQAFLDVTLPKIRRARTAIDGSGIGVAIQVDGGITEETITRAAEAGANVFVAGSAVYGADDPAAAIDRLREEGSRSLRKATAE